MTQTRKLHKVKSASQFQKNWDDLASEILSRPTFEDNSPEARAERKKRAEASAWEMARIYFPDYVSKKPSKFHKSWEKIAAIDNEPCLIEAFRGAGKSTFFSFIDTVHKVLFSDYHFFLFSSYTEAKSKVFTGRILIEFKYNERLIADFGKLVPEGSERSAIGDFVLKDPERKRRVHIMACSIGQDPRGLVSGPYRPDYVRLDDIQNRKRAKSRKWVKYTVDWILLDLLPALADPFDFKIVATAMNSKDVVSTLKKKDNDRASVKNFRFPLLDEKKHSTWPDYFTKQRINRILLSMGLANFKQEFQLIPKKEDDDGVREEWIKYYNPDEVEDSRYEVIVSWSDLGSRKTHNKTDYKATVCIGIKPGPVIDVLAARIKREQPKAMIKAMYRIYDNQNPMRMYWEDNGQQSLIIDTFDSIAEEQGYSLPLQGITNTVNKELRIETTLFHRLENGEIRFNKEDHFQKQLIEQLLDLFEGEHDDGPDALEGAVRMGLKLFKNGRDNGCKAGRPRATADLLELYE